MSLADQEHLEHLVSMLPKSGKWRWVAVILAVPALVGAMSALAAYGFATVTFLSGVNYAVKVVPSHDAAILRIDGQVKAVTNAENETRDTLRMNGYYLRSIP